MKILGAWLHVHTFHLEMYVIGHASGFLFHRLLNHFSKKKAEAKKI